VRYLVLLTLFICFLWPSNGCAETYLLGVQPCWNPEKSLVMFQPLVQYLSRVLHSEVKLVVYDNAEQFHQDLQRVHFVLQDAYSTYVHSYLERFEPLAVAVVKDGSLEERGAIIVRKESPYHKIKDLRGKRFLFGALHNTPKFFATWILFEKNGLNPREDFSQIGLGGECLFNALAVVVGDYDAAAVCADFLESEEARKVSDHLRVLALTDPVPGWMFTIAPRIGPALRQKVRKAVLSLEPDSVLAQEVLRDTPWKGFVRPRGNELTEIERLVHEYHIPEKL